MRIPFVTALFDYTPQPNPSLPETRYDCQYFLLRTTPMLEELLGTAQEYVDDMKV